MPRKSVQAIYKCQRCGEIIKSPDLYHPDDVELAARGIPNLIPKGHTPSKSFMHNCNIREAGLCVLIGFNKPGRE